MPPRTSPIKLGPFEMAIPAAWSGRFAALLFVGTVGFGVYWAYDRIADLSTRIAPGDLIQLEQAQRHLTETPESTLTVFDDVRGKLIVRAFSSDGCLLVERRAVGAPTSTRFVPDLSRSQVASEPAPLPPIFGAAAARAQGRCLTVEQHGAPVKMWSEQINGCQIRAHRSYADGCHASAVYDSCASTWSSWVFGSCRH